MTGLLIGLLVSQGLFARTFGGTDYDYGYSIAATADGGYIVSGTTWNFGAGNADCFILRLDSQGVLQWARTYGGGDYDYAEDITPTSDGGYAIAGRMASFAVNYDFILIKTNSVGAFQWASRFWGGNYEYLYSVTQTTDGGFALAGETTTYGAGAYDILVVKTDATGAFSWARTFGGLNYDRVNSEGSITRTADGGVAVTGCTENFGAGGFDVMAVKLSAAGNVEWVRTLGGPANERGYTIIQTTDAGFALTGYTASYGAGSADVLVVKMDSLGRAEWARAIGGDSSDYGYSLVQAPDGGYVIAGSTNSFGAGGGDFLAVRLSSSGDLEWARTFGGPSGDGAASITTATDGGYVLAGRTSSYGQGNGDIMVIKLDANGNYSDCVADCNPTMTAISPDTSSPSVGASTTTGTSSPTPTVMGPNPSVADACPPLSAEETDATPERGITCSPVPGGALFLSPSDTEITIYSADGRVAYLGKLQKGENRIGLETGVYIWQAGAYRGKVAVR